MGDVKGSLKMGFALFGFFFKKIEHISILWVCMGDLLHTSDWISNLQRNLQERVEGIQGKSR